MAQQMNAQDVLAGGSAECYLTINGRRYNFMQMTEFESKWEPTIIEVPILGKVGMGHKPAGGKGTWTGMAHYNQSVLRQMADTYQKTGVLQYFTIQVTNVDQASAAGRQTVIHYNCLSDSFILAKFTAGDEEILDEDLSGTFDSFDLPETFTPLAGM